MIVACRRLREESPRSVRARLERDNRPEENATSRSRRRRLPCFGRAQRLANTDSASEPLLPYRARPPQQSPVRCRREPGISRRLRSLRRRKASSTTRTPAANHLDPRKVSGILSRKHGRRRPARTKRTGTLLALVVARYEQHRHCERKHDRLAARARVDGVLAGDAANLKPSWTADRCCRSEAHGERDSSRVPCFRGGLDLDRDENHLPASRGLWQQGKALPANYGVPR